MGRAGAGAARPAGGPGIDPRLLRIGALAAATVVLVPVVLAIADGGSGDDVRSSETTLGTIAPAPAQAPATTGVAVTAAATLDPSVEAAKDADDESPPPRRARRATPAPTSPVRPAPAPRRGRRLLAALRRLVRRHPRRVAGGQRRPTRHPDVRGRRALHPRRRAGARADTTTVAVGRPPHRTRRRLRPQLRRPRPQPPPRSRNRRAAAAPAPTPQRASAGHHGAPAGIAGPAEVEALIRKIWPDDIEDRAIRIADNEANLRPDLNNWCCYGVFALYFDYVPGDLKAQYGVDEPSDLYDPRTNISIAYQVYLRGGWDPWSRPTPAPDPGSVPEATGLHWSAAPPALVAQWIEHLTTDQKVGSSTLSSALSESAALSLA